MFFLDCNFQALRSMVPRHGQSRVVDVQGIPGNGVGRAVITMLKYIVVWVILK